ncbi:MAG: CoA transferase [Actinobacteria bacterium]|nr:CoA transferase [Actinomycetota bacterium]
MLGGVTVLDLSTVGPAARASRTIADYGATVVKIGAVPRAGGVQIIPPHYAYSGGRGMKRIQLDLKAKAGTAAFLRLAATADVIIESFRPGVVDRLGIGYADVKAVNDSIVYCSTSGYGQTGPYREWAGHDVNYLAIGGYLHCSGRGAGGKPPLPGATVADAAAGGMQAVMGVLAALVRRADTGEGAYLDVAIADGVLSLMALSIDEYLALGTEPGPGHYVLTGKYACYDTYECGDGGWVAVGAIEAPFYANLCRRLGCEQWIEHQYDDDAGVQDKIRADFAACLRTRTRDEWVAELAPNDTCVAPVYSVPELVADPHFRERGLFGTATSPTAGSFAQLGTVLAGTDTARAEFAVPDRSSTETDEVLAGAGYTSAEIAALRNDGVIA